MSDIYISLEDKNIPNADVFSELCFKKNVFSWLEKTNNCTVFVTQPNKPALWQPASDENGNYSAFLSGRIALSINEWNFSLTLPGRGGVVCRYIIWMYQKYGAETFKNLNGNFIACFIDKTTDQFFLCTDKMGTVPCYHDCKYQTFSTHPDFLAKTLNESDLIDKVSVAEFLCNGKILAPNSYYKNICIVPPATLITIKTSKCNVVGKSQYFNLDTKYESTSTLDTLADELSSSIISSVEKRTAPILGKTAISLSGGLDSRILLAAVPKQNKVESFTFTDYINYEFKLAKKIALTSKVAFHPLMRSPDFYAENALIGAKVLGGIGNIFANHYLGFTEDISGIGVENIISGLFCDVLFKGYFFNARKNKITRKNKFDDFSYEYDQRFYQYSTSLGKLCQERLNAYFPKDMREDNSQLGNAMLEIRRLWPIHMDDDNASYLIPYRYFGWYLPFVDDDVIEVFKKIPPVLKLNGSVFNLAVKKICNTDLLKIPNANTGVSADANYVKRLFGEHYLAIKRKLRKFQQSTNESWPNWEYYLKNSLKIKDDWESKNDKWSDLCTEVLGNAFKGSLNLYTTGETPLLRRIISLKYWLENRIC